MTSDVPILEIDCQPNLNFLFGEEVVGEGRL
jgi:hypothetical protein